MLKLNTGFRLGRLVVGTILVVGLAGPAFAGNVYSWVTEDGTYAFTDDSKRIPAKHRSEAKRRSMGKLTRYERFTEVSADLEKPYAERIRERRDQLRDVAAVAVAPQGAIAGGMTSSDPGLGYTIPVGGGSRGARSTASVWVPLDKTAMQRIDEEEAGPTVIESKRMRTPGKLTSRHWTFITKGDKVVTVIKGEHRDRKPEEAISESKYDYWDPSNR